MPAKKSLVRGLPVARNGCRDIYNLICIVRGPNWITLLSSCVHCLVTVYVTLLVALYFDFHLCYPCWQLIKEDIQSQEVSVHFKIVTFFSAF